MKILVTGFKPFLGSKINPSEQLAIEVEKRFSQVDSVILPVEFENSYTTLVNERNPLSYDYILMLGQAAGRTRVCFEKIALNWCQTDHADERGFRPITGKIKPKVPQLALMTELNIDGIVTKLKEQDLPVEISFSAGTFVCNDLYYRLLLTHPQKKIVFIHVPAIYENQLQEKKLSALDYDALLAVVSETIQILLVERP